MYEFHLFELRNDKVNVRKIITVIHVHVKLQLTGMQLLLKESLKKTQACQDSNPDLCDTN